MNEKIHDIPINAEHIEHNYATGNPAKYVVVSHFSYFSAPMSVVNQS
jgi:hypothetical protein